MRREEHRGDWIFPSRDNRKSNKWQVGRRTMVAKMISNDKGRQNKVASTLLEIMVDDNWLKRILH